MPVAIHIGDPKAFWKPVSPENERWDELRVHPSGRSTAPDPVVAAAVRRVRTAGRAPQEDHVHRRPLRQRPGGPDNVARMLDKYPNFFIDTAARVPEIGRHPQEKMRKFYAKYQDRVLFGTDTGIGPDDADMMYGSNGADVPTPRGRGPLLHVDLALLRDDGPPVREPDADPGALEDRRRRPARIDPAQNLFRERDTSPALASARYMRGKEWIFPRAGGPDDATKALPWPAATAPLASPVDAAAHAGENEPIAMPVSAGVRHPIDRRAMGNVGGAWTRTRWIGAPDLPPFGLVGEPPPLWRASRLDCRVPLLIMARLILIRG
jgi:hypothetical protein